MNVATALKYNFETGIYRPPSEGGSYSLLVRVTSEGHISGGRKAMEAECRQWRAGPPASSGISPNGM